MSIINGRYQIIKREEKDIFGTYYKASDLSKNKAVVKVKILNDEYFIEDLYAHYSKNFLKYASLIHPNLVGAIRFDLLRSRDNRRVEKLQYFYVVEYYDTMASICYDTLNLEERWQVIARILYALRYLHFKGIAYGKLFDDNLLITRSSNGALQLKLKDLPSVLHAFIVDIEGSGTNSLASEVVRGEHICFSSDVFSVSYYIKQLLDQHYQNPSYLYPELYHLLVLNTNEDIEIRNPNLDDLIKALQVASLLKMPFVDKGYYARINFNVAMVSREPEFSDIMSHITKKLESYKGLKGALITGDTGIGKSRLVQEIAFSQRTRGRFVVRADFVQKSNQPYRLFTKIIKTIVQKMEIPDALIDKYGAEVVKILPELIDVWHVRPSVPLSKANELLKVNNRLVQFMITLSQHADIIIILENIDLLNENERVLLEMMFTNEFNTSLFIICTAKMSNSIVRHYTRQQIGEIFYKTYDLSRLDQSDVLVLLNEFFFLSEGMEEFSKIVSDATNGNPRIIEAMLKHLLINKVISVSKDRKWHIGEIDLKNIDILKDSKDLHTKTYQVLDNSSKKILQVISLFDAPVDKVIIEDCLSLNDVALDFLLEHLSMMNILKVDKQGIKENYFYSNGEFKKVVHHAFEKEYLKQLHRRLAEILENRPEISMDYHRDYLNHLIKSEQPKKAMQWAIDFGEKMVRKGLIDNAIKHYKIAMSLSETLDDIATNVYLIKVIADIKLKAGETQDARILYDVLYKITKQNHLEKDHIECRIKQLELQIRRKDYEGVDLIITSIKNAALKIEHDSAILELGLCIFKYYTSANQLERAGALVEDMLALAQRLDNHYYIGRYYTIKGIYQDISGDYYSAFNCFNLAIPYLSTEKHVHELSIVHNNLGVLSFDILGDVVQAKQNFVKALNLIGSAHIFVDRNNYFNNLGEVYCKEGNFERAIKVHEKALHMSEDTDDVDGIIMSLTLLVEAHVFTSQYDWAYKYIVKLESCLNKYAEISHYSGIERARYSISLFYLKLLDGESAAYYYDDVLVQSTSNIDHLASFRLHVHKLEMLYFLTDNRLNSYIDFTHLNQLSSIATHGIEEQILKEALLNIMIDMMCFDNREQIFDLLSVYNQIGEVTHSALLNFKEKVVFHYVEKDGNIIDLVNDITSNHFEMSLEDKWRIFVIVANYYAIKGDYYKGLRYYMESIDIIKSIYDRLEVDFKERYIMNDALKFNLFDCVHILLSKIDKNNTEQWVFNKESFFNIEPFETTLDTDEFKASIKAAYVERYGVVFNGLEDLLQQMNTDSIFNIHLMLKYTSQLTLSDRSYLLITGNDGSVEEHFSVDKEFEEQDFNKLLVEYAVGSDAKIISEKALSERRIKTHKGMMFIPVAVTNHIASSYDNNRRKNTLTQQDIPYAYLFMYTDSRLNNFNEHTLNLLKSLTPLVFLLVENYKLYRASTVDKLTGLYLRKYIERKFKRQIEEYKQTRESLSVVMLDIDHFKMVNDTYGHRKGDEVLQSLAKILKESVRNEDLVGRYGGEEFIILLPTADREKAFEITERVRVNIERAKLLGEERSVTISAGISVFPSMGKSEADLIEKADQALYESKKSGRNKTTIYSRKEKRKTKRYDKLTGILSGILTKDTRTLKALIDIIEVISEKSSTHNKIKFILRTIIDTVEALDATIVLQSEEDVKIYKQRRGTGKLEVILPKNPSFFIEQEGIEQEGYFIKWDDLSDIDGATGKPNWKSHLQCPIVSNGQKLGMLRVRVAINEREFDAGDYNLISHISGIISAVL